GYGSSTHGNFEIRDGGVVVWSYLGFPVDVGIKIPTNTEVLVVTMWWFEKEGPSEDAQRFVWVGVPGVGGGWHMIE
ncbi:hypothetical protein COX53_00580, partial [candidate division WWE3 bacterium CG23_combo_of_CG06-09_8_20_14_all_40_14]